MVGGLVAGPSTQTTVGLIASTSTSAPDTTTTTSAGTTIISTTTTEAPEDSTTTTSPTTTATSGSGVFDEVAAVSAFIEEFAEAISASDVDFLYERLHPAVKATYEEAACRELIEDQILALEDYRAIGPVTGPFDSEFGGFPVTTYEVEVAYTFDETDFESSASYSLTEGTVRWFAHCET